MSYGFLGGGSFVGPYLGERDPLVGAIPEDGMGFPRRAITSLPYASRVPSGDRVTMRPFKIGSAGQSKLLDQTAGNVRRSKRRGSQPPIAVRFGRRVPLLEPLELRALLSADLYEAVFNDLASRDSQFQPATTLSAISMPDDARDCAPTNPINRSSSDSLIVRVSPGTNFDALLATEIPGAVVIGRVALVGGLYQVDLPKAVATSDAIDLLESLESVQYVERDHYLDPQELSSAIDVSFAAGPAAANVSMTSGLLSGNGITAFPGVNPDSGGPIVVAVIDTGIDFDHPDFAGRIWNNSGEVAGDGIDNDGNGYVDDISGWNFRDNNNRPQDTHGHGTHIAGTVGRVTPQVKIMPLKILGSDLRGTVFDAIAALDYAVANGAQISNNSYVDMAHESFRDAIVAAGSAGHIFVAAAGNGGQDIDASPVYPASYHLDNMFTVAATTQAGTLASWSNYGATTVDLAAPGERIYSTLLGGGYSFKSGTSMAAPQVAGAVALIRALRPYWSIDQVRDVIQGATTTVSNESEHAVISGQLDVDRAMELLSSAVRDGGTADESSPGNTVIGLPQRFRGESPSGSEASDAEDSRDTATLLVGLGAEWTAIPGIPEPPSILLASNTMYAGTTYDFGSGPVPYPVGPNGPYTHYVDPGDPNSTDVNNPFGSYAKPRKSYPALRNLAPGSVVELRGGSYGAELFEGSGTAEAPIFIRGVADYKPTVTPPYNLHGSYYIFENINFDFQDQNARAILFSSASSYIAIRNCDFHNFEEVPSSGRALISVKNTADATKISNILFSGNNFYDLGTGRAGGIYDVTAIYGGVNSEYVWIVDNQFSYIGGDGVQLNMDGAVEGSTPPNHYFIGRNTFHDNYENAVDLKMCQDVVISKNVAHSMVKSPAFRYGNMETPPSGMYRHNIWTIFNEVYNSVNPDGAFTSWQNTTNPISDEIYYIGNFVHDSHNATGDAGAFAFQDQAHIYAVNNTIYNVDRGFSVIGERPTIPNGNEQFVIANNIISDLHSGTQAPYHLQILGTDSSLQRSIIRNNLFYEPDGQVMIRWGTYDAEGIPRWNEYTYNQFVLLHPDKLLESVQADPLFANPAAGQFQLQSGSPAIDAGLAQAYFETFYQRFGIRISVDFAGAPAPDGVYDMGAFEFSHDEDQNAAPSITVPGAKAGVEDTLLSITGISVSDADAGTGPLKVSISVGSGRLTLARITGLTFTAGDGTSDASMVFTGSLANINAALTTVDYAANVNFNRIDTLSIGVDDQGNTGAGGAKFDSKSVSITVSAVNDAPVLTVPGAQSAMEDTVKAITGISVVDVDAASGPVKITMSVTNGRFTLAQAGGLTFTSGDGTGDVSMVFTGAVADVNAALATIDYLANTNYVGSDILNVSVDDQGNTGAGGSKAHSRTTAIAVAAVNDAPVLVVPGGQSATEDLAKSITGINVSDVDAASGSVKISLAVASGRLTLARTAGLTFTTGDGTADGAMIFTGNLANVNASLATVTYLPNANFAGNDTLVITADDLGNSGSGGAKTDSKTISIAVAGVNDAPVLTVPGGQATTEDSAKSIAGISVADVDADTGAIQITISAANGILSLLQTTGLAFTVGDGTGDVSMVFTGTVANVNSALATITYLGNVNFNGSDTISVSVDDRGNSGSGGSLTSSRSIAVSVTPLNDAPIVTVPGLQSAVEDTVRPIAGISITDVDAASGAIKVTVSVGSGRLTLAQTTNLLFTTGDGNSDATMVFTGSLANVNFALATVNYLANANFSGTDTLVISVDDQGNVGSGGAKVDSESVAISVSAVNDAPVVTVPAEQAVSEDSVKVISGISVADVDAANGSLRFTISVTNGLLSLAQIAGLTFITGDGVRDALMVFSGALANLNAALATVSYLGNTDFSGSDTLSVAVDDQGFTGAGGAKTDSKTVAISVASVNDSPYWLVPGVQKTPSGTAKDVTGISIVDIDAGSSVIEATLTVSRGSLTLSRLTGINFLQGDGKADPTITFRGTLADVNAALGPLAYRPDVGYSGLETMVLSVSDLGNTGSGGAKTDTRTIAIEVGNISLFSGLAAWWNLNEGGGMRVADTSVSQFDDSGSLRGNAQWNIYGADGAVTVDGDGDGIDVPSSTEVNNFVVTTRTIAAWFYVADKSVVGRNQVIFEEGGDQRGLNIYLSNGRLYVGGWNLPATESGWTGTFLSTDQIQSGHWHHVTLVLSGGATVSNNALRAYLDGVEFGSGAGSQLWAHQDPTGIGQASAYARFHNGLASGGNGFAGMLDDVRVYNRALTASEVAELATQTMSAPCQLTVNVTPENVWENGSAITGTVTRTGATNSALTVNLSSTNKGRLQVPATLVIGVGEASATFLLTPQDNLLADGTSSVVIAAAAIGCSGSQDVLEVWDDELPAANLAGYWALNEGTGLIANDSASPGANDVGSLRGTAAWSSMGLGRSVQFSGGVGVVAVQDSAEINLMTVTQRTVSLWFQVAVGDLTGSRQVLFEEGGTDRGLSVYLDGGRLYVGGWNVTASESGWAGTFLSTDQIQAGRWHNVVLVLNGGATVQANGLKGYLDGSLFGSGVASQLWSHGDDTGIGRAAQYTRFHDGLGTTDRHGVSGLIDEVRMYNRVLRDHEIQVLAGQSLVSADGLTVSFASTSFSEHGGSVQGTVTRTGSMSSPLIVTLGSSDTSEATVPTSVTIAAGQAYATFTVSGVDDPVRDGTASVSITATATGLVAGSGQVQVVDDEKLLVQGVVSNVTNSWVTVNLPQQYGSMVVVATPSYTSSSIPVVTRVRNATGSSFEMRVDRADGQTGAVPGVTVHYVVAEEGVYTQARDGVKMEVVKYASTVTDSAGSFVGESRAYAQAYAAPVVLGQVQTYNDANFSVFWSRGATAADPASGSVLRVGKHVGEDAYRARATETVGYFVIEAGLSNVDGAAITAGVGGRTVQGMGNAPAYSYSLSGLTAASVAVASMAGQVGADGGWAVLYGNDAVSASRLQLAVDEDRKRDTERAHTTESISYLVFQDSALTLNRSTERSGETAMLRIDQVERLVDRAIALWDVGETDPILGNLFAELALSVEDLPGDELARATRHGVILDRDASGQGWFVDPTPSDDEEFFRDLDGSLRAFAGTGADSNIDLLTVLAHELGHLHGVGHDHHDNQSVMWAVLGVGMRRYSVSS